MEVKILDPEDFELKLYSFTKLIPSSSVKQKVLEQNFD